MIHIANNDIITYYVIEMFLDQYLHCYSSNSTSSSSFHMRITNDK